MKKIIEYCLKFKKTALILLFIPVVGILFSIYISSEVFATDETINLQGRIVRNDTGNEGLNVSAGSPSCVFLGGSNDTCDFRVKYYSADTLGTLLATEVFANKEIGEYNGVFNLVLGTGTFTPGSETSFRNIFINNTAVYVEMDFAPDGSTYTETFLNADGKRMAVRAVAYAISAKAANEQFQFDLANDETGYSDIAAGQVFYDGNDNVLRLYDGSNWLAIQASIGNLPSYWLLNEATTPDVIYSYTGLDVAFGGTDSTAPFFYDVSGELLTLTNTTAGLSFRVNDVAGDTSPFAIDANGNVGVGTDAPGAKLEVTGGRTILQSLGESQTLGIGRTDGAGLYWLGVNASSTPALSFLNNGGVERFRISDTGGLTQIGANDSSVGLSLQKATVDATHIEWRLFNAANNKDLTISGYNGTNAYNFVNFDWDNQVSNFETGRVGIGVASPNAFLAIKAATTGSAQLNLVSSAGVDPSSPTSGDLWWNGTNLYFFDGSSSVDLLVGGGPGGSLFTDGGAITYLTSITDDFALGGSTSSSPFFFSASNKLLTLTNTTSGLSFRVNDEASDTTPFVIDADGNVGIGTSTPGAKLEVAGVSSVISNTAGDITFDSASGNLSFAGDSITNALNATFSGNVVLNGGQLQLGNHVSNPTSIGEGSVVYNSTDKKLYYYKDTGWSEVGKVYTGTTGQMLRHDGTDWVASSVLTNDGTNITSTGQVRVGNYGTKPTGIGAGALVYDTTLGSLFVYDGTDWKAISTSQMLSTNGTVNDGEYLQLTHNLNTFDLISSAWVKVGTQWKQALDNSNSVIQDFDNEFAAFFREKKKVSSVKINYNENDLGTGADGAITISGNIDINVTNSISGRSCADGGDAVNYSVSSIPSNTSVVLESTPSAGCLSANDEVLLINLRGTGSAYTNTGNYETLRISSIVGSTINFVSAKTKYYGSGASDEANIGLGSLNQTVMLQRVPNYTSVTVNSGATFYPADWVQPTGAVNNGAGEGGIMFFRATGSVSIAGSIHATGKGYLGTTTNALYSSYAYGGEAFCAGNGAPGSDSGGAAGGNNGTSWNGYTNNKCGGGAGGGYSGTGSSGTALGGAGGAGGGSSANNYGVGGGGAGGGYGGGGTGGIGAYNNTGTDGSTNQSGNGGVGNIVTYGYGGGGGGGGTYGDTAITKLYFGSAGGGGGGGTVGGVTTYGGGVAGDGGGAIYIAANSIAVTGALRSNGNSGGNGQTSGGWGGGGGGGGAGGSIKLVGNSVTVNANTSAYGAGGGAGVAGNGTGASNGGTGGSGRIAVYYSNSISGTSSPAQQTFTLSYNSYAVYISKEVHTPDATSYGNIGWTESLPSGTEIQLQTRSGATPNSKDGTWEAWKPTTSSLVINDLNTHTDFTGTNVTVADGDITRNIDYHEDEDEFTSGNITKLTATLANGYAETTLSPSVDLSSYTYITAWVRSSFAGNSIKLGFGESAGTEQEKIISVDSINTWQKVYWDISGITGTSRDAVTKFRVTLPTNTTVAYIDSIKAESYLTTPGGSTITSTANDYIQYRAILTTSNTANTPTLSAITVGYTNPSGTYTIDANRVKNLVDVDFYQSNRLTLTEYPLVDYKKLRTLVGPNQVAQNTVNDLGNGSDGARTISTNVNINVSNTPGRSCADGGDAVNYSVTSFPDNTSAVLESASSTGCLSVNDEVLLINLRGTGTQYANVGNYETLRISSISGTTVNFATSKTKYYGNGTSDDTNIGLGVGNQTVMLQRVPNYTDVTVEVGTIFSPDEWVQPTGAVNNGAGEGGVIFFRATGTVSVAGIVSAWARGYAASTTATGYATYAYGGEAFCAGNVAPPGDSGGGAGGNNGTQYAGYTNNKCGGGGGAGYINSTGGAGIAVGGAGGAGGASSSSNYGIGGGGGGGGYGGGGSGGVGALNNGGWNGSTNQSGAGGNSIASTYGYAGGGGGGGTYGDSDLTKLFFGASGGNGGGGMSNTTSYNGGIGGDGGGIVFIAGSTVSVSGYLTSAGSAGTTAAGSGGWGGGGGGGGAGGSIKVVGNSVSLGTASTTSGGSGGAGNMGGGSYAANGGAGGVGRIAVYSATNPTGTTTPTFTSTTIPGYNYGVFVSEEIPTYQATDYGNLAWNFNDNGYGDIQFQTRSGASNNSTDGTWEAWKPVTQGTNYIDLNNMNTVGDWTVTNQSVVADGDATRNIDYSEDEDEGTVGNISKFVSTSANGYAEDTITSTDLSNYDYISAWVYSGTTGNILKLGFGESSATENEETINIDRANTWQKVYWDIRDVDKSLRNAVTKIRMTIIPTSTTIQLDNMKGERLLRNSSGSTITSTVNNYIQYRAVFTTTNESYKPTLYNVQLTWKTGYKLVNTDANTTRLYNYSGQTQDLRINVTTSGGASALGSGWTEVGGNVYRGSGFVGIGDATPDVELKVVGALCVKSNADACAGATAGTIYANNTSVQSADLAEMYEVSDLSIEAGDLVSLDPNAIGEVQKANPDNVASVMGVVSTSPGLLMNDNNKDNSRPIGLIGRLPVKVMTAGRSVEKGDVITASALDGIGVTRNDSGIIVAKALEDTFDWSDASCTTVNTISDIKWPADKGQNESKPCFKVPVDSFEASLRGTLMNTYNLTLSDSIYIGKVMAFVDVVWYQPQWVSDEMASLLSDYSGGRLGGEGSGWTIEGDSLKTDKEVSVNRIEGTSANFGILNGNLLNIGNGSLVSDSGGNLSVGGDLLIAGHLKSESGSLVLEIGSSINDMFVIKNVKGEVVFSVDGTGSVGGKGIYRSEWVRISPNSSLKVHHNFNATPSSINIIKSDNSQGYGFTSKGLGSEYYFEYYDSNTIQVYNKTSGVIYVKLTIEK